LNTSRWTWLALAATVGAVAFVVRLFPVLRGGGLRGFYNYDPAVYYAAAVGMARGMLPYRDFLLLHPPGVPLLLLPFAALGQVTSDSTGMAAARLAMMAMGSVTAIIITRTLRSAGVVPALIGGLAYAVYWPAVYSERATWLEGPGSFLLAVALWLLIAPPRFLETRPRWTYALAGAALAFACLTKMWLAVPLLVLVVWVAAHRRWRDLGWLTVGGAVAGIVPLLPFVTALPQLWNMVVTTQFGRRRGTSDVTSMRLEGLSGLDQVWSGHIVTLAIVVVVVGGAVAALAVLVREGRLPLLVTVASLALLLTTPTWFRHYPTLVAPTLMMSIGFGSSVVGNWLRHRWLQIVAGVAAVAVLGWHAWVLGSDRVGTSFDGDQLARIAAVHPGCVTTDDPNALIAGDLFKANLARGCSFVIDLSGYRYYLGDRSTFTRNKAWQEFVATYLSDGSLNVMLRGTSADRIEPGFYSRLQSWPEVARINGRVVRAQP
jgi:hypothetical protein